MGQWSLIGSAEAVAPPGWSEHPSMVATEIMKRVERNNRIEYLSGNLSLVDSDGQKRKRPRPSGAVPHLKRDTV